MTPRKLIPYVALAAFVAGLQLSLTALGKPFYLTAATMAVYYAMVVMGLCLLMGYAGQTSLGHGAFVAIGGYTSAALTTHNLAPYAQSGWVKLLQKAGAAALQKNLYDGTETLTVTPWAAFGAAMALTLVVALVIGYPALRLKGHYLAMATLGFGLIVYRLLLGMPFLGSADGITGVPPWRLGAGLSLSGQSEARVENYYLAWALAAGVLLLLSNLVNSRAGRALRAIHDNELAANAMGINTARAKLQVFVLSAMLAAAAGCFVTHFNGGIGPSEAGAMKSVRYVALAAASGMANLWGGLIISTALNFVSLRGWFGTLDSAVFGIILIVIVSVAPDGPLKPAGAWVQGRLRAWRERKAGHGAA